MATLSRTSGKLLKNVQFSPVLTRNLSNVKYNKTLPKVLTTCACVIGGGVLYYGVNKYGIKKTVYALKAKILAVLNFFANGSYQRNVGASYLLSMSQPSFSKCLHEVIDGMNARDLLLKYIKFPSSQREREIIMTDFMEKFGFPGVIGCIDGTHVALIRPMEHEEAFFNRKNYHSLNVLIPDELAKSVKLTSRERRFIKFASVEYGGQLYMTPQDFLESVVEQEPRPRLKRRVLTTKEIEHLRDHTPQLKKGSAQMFRNMRDKGIISYTEYLFLLSILTKPASGFRIAFNMFDTDGNQRVDKNEFLVIQRLLGGTLKERKNLDAKSEEALLSIVPTSATRNRMVQTEKVPKPSIMEKIFSYAWKGKRGMTDDKEEGKEGESKPHDTYVNDDQGLQRRHNVDTFLQVHFFGKKGTNDLKFEGFKQFMENLQTEVLELEFHEFSKGHETISEVDFAKILLRYTYLDTDEYDMYLDRLLDRVKDERGITFDEFKTFCQFLNNLEDFTIAMRMYTLADHPISKDEFHRAVKICTGISQSEHLVSTVFAIFDADGDGLLSYKEFIAIMKDRLHRGFKSYAKNEGWEAFKTCVKQEMKSAV